MRHKRLVILVFGEKRAGKNTAAEILAGAFDGVVDAFADPLKKGVELLVGIPADLPDGEKETKLFYGRTARWWWQWYGTEIGRTSVHKSVWVRRAADRIRGRENPVTVISDARFYNEHGETPLLLSETTVVKVLIHRPGLSEADMHPSETEIRNMRKRQIEGGENLFDYTILNDGPVELFRERVKLLAEDIAVQSGHYVRGNA